MSLFENAVQAITCGLEDYKMDTDARLRSAIRNVHAGILLLFKTKLQQLSEPDTKDALIKKRIVPQKLNNQIKWIGDGKNTVDVQDIKTRFKWLDIKANWKDFDALNNIRNDVEHYFPIAKKEVISESLAKAFSIVVDFMQNQLSIDPKTMFESGMWEDFINIHEVWIAERNRCLESYRYFKCSSSLVSDNVDNIACLICDSELMLYDGKDSFSCRACGESFFGGDVIVDLLSGLDYDQCDPAVVHCPNCGEKSLVVAELQCPLCGEKVNGECKRCLARIPTEELDGGDYCGYCSHMIDKVMNDE
ncbi:MAG TPA: hypothetical protein DCG57_04290 [Candidatus Riflebacteria bacterium]|nr:hypothetical protein [Candidatus Riflebacteria bacterium]